ncbi:DUF6087 family protein [Streptomyces sp. NPDC047976]|uniref:DUF6087 family protein n=1 Tax=unclassified Streptomyces TaxID=2593676 RepID=UPI0034456942
MDDEEPLAEWAARREGRLRQPGELKALTLGSGPQRAAHLNPGAPRLIMEWDGFAWQPLTTVDDYAAACAYMNPVPAPQSQQPEQPMPKKAPGRHRKP